jgi:tetratricopeptide (TPR) repeat protein
MISSHDNHPVNGHVTGRERRDLEAAHAEAAQKRPTDARGWLERGLRSAQLGFPDHAAADFEEASWLDPENADIQFNLGTAYLSMGMFEQAIVNLTNAIDLRPGMSDAIGNRAVAFTALGDDEAAARDVQRAIQLGAPPDGLTAVLEYVKTKRRPGPSR